MRCSVGTNFAERTALFSDWDLIKPLPPLALWTVYVFSQPSWIPCSEMAYEHHKPTQPWIKDALPVLLVLLIAVHVLAMPPRNRRKGERLTEGQGPLFVNPNLPPTENLTAVECP
ncbi:hypothetical protein V8G54_006983 [Vigna mungo]|uniref:Uncharacterized protein n=1 Tax=Vigna mungo TaxID=3915 RepID=A0AAQ3P025_VIGMU